MDKEAVNKINIAEKTQTSEFHCLRKSISHEYPRKADTGLMIPAHYAVFWSSPHDSYPQSFIFRPWESNL